MASSIGSRDSVSFLLTIQATGLLTFVLVGLPPTEYASLRWTHQHAGLSRRTPVGRRFARRDWLGRPGRAQRAGTGGGGAPTCGDFDPGRACAYISHAMAL